MHRSHSRHSFPYGKVMDVQLKRKLKRLGGRSTWHKVAKQLQVRKTRYAKHDEFKIDFIGELS